VNEKCAAEICLAFDMDTRARFNVLRQEFGKNDLFGEKFGADRNPGNRGSPTTKGMKRQDAGK
jgi:hypothetical protein